MEGNK